MAISPGAYEKRLEKISAYRGMLYGRILAIFDEESKHQTECDKYRGYSALSNGFKAFFLETVERTHTELRLKLKAALSEHYALFLPRLAHSFKSLCGAERIAVLGYPLHGYTLLRNTFDNLVLVSGVLQKFADSYSIEGVEPGKGFDPIAAKKLRKQTEFKVREVMTGRKSGLSEQTMIELEHWDAMFDYETHGARLTLASSMEWMKGTAALPVLPQFNERDMAMFMNRFAEIGWMAHRLVPAIQPPGVIFGDDWKEKWRIIDDSFEIMVNSLTAQLGKKIGGAIVEFVKRKFPFNEGTSFPL